MNTRSNPANIGGTLTAVPVRTLLVSLVLLLAVVFTASRSGHDASADHGAPIAGTVDIVAVDTNTSGNINVSTTSAPYQALGTLNSCRDGLSIGNTFLVDIIVDEIHSSDGITGFDGTIAYNPAVLKVNSHAGASPLLFMQRSGSTFLYAGDSLPDTDGNYQYSAVDISIDAESDVGVVARFTMEVVGSGMSALDLTDNIEMDGTPNIVDASSAYLTVNNTIDGEVHADGSSCVADGNYVVDTASDLNLNACTGAAGDCSLRGAMNNAAFFVSANTITFDTSVFPATCPCPSWVTGSPLPTLSGNGDTINGIGAGVYITAAGADPCFNLSGNSNTLVSIELVSGCATAVQVTGANNTVGGSNVGEGAGLTCLDAVDSDTDGIVNDGCPQSGATAEAGADCLNTTDDDLIDTDGFVNDGCPARGYGIRIASNTQEGVLITGEGADGNTILGNWIGLSATLFSADGNNIGVAVGGGADNNIIGSFAAAARNVISGNGASGVEISGGGSTTNTVIGNYVGTNAAGTGAVANGGSGIAVVGSASNTIGGMTVTPGSPPGNVISGNSGEGVHVSGANGNTIKGNFIGTGANGTSDLGNALSGVFISGVSSSNIVGGTTAGERNVISGNDGWGGVTISGADADTNTVQGNYIGTDATGAADLGNLFRGVSIEAGNGNVIGGSAAGIRNVISGNDYIGVNIFNSASGNFVRGNYIGINAAGTGARANGGGIQIDGSPSNTIGGSTADERNVISANVGVGIQVNSGSTGTTIKGNYVGTDAAGAIDLGNGNAGVRLQASGATVGGSAAGEGNIISGNQTGGLDIQGTFGTVVHGNYIGTNPAGANIGNTQFGVELDSSSNSNNVGSNAFGEGNTIAFNSTDGVVVIDGTATGNPIRGNSIYSNGELGIDLNPNGVTANDAGDGDTGANGLENYPIVTAATYVGTTLTISGTLDNTDGALHGINVFLADSVDGSGYGEGRQVLGGFPGATGPSGSWSLILPGAPFPSGAFVTATSTDNTTGNTSEFSAVFHTDFDGDGVSSATDNCPLAHNPRQENVDGDSVGDVCDTAVRNRFEATSSSIDVRFTTAPGQALPIQTRMIAPWDINPTSSTPIGGIVAEINYSYRHGDNCSSSTGDAQIPALQNAIPDDSSGLVNDGQLGADDDSDGIPNGVEKYPSFLNGYLDPDRLSMIDNDGDGSIDEDVANDNDDDFDGEVDEDPAGTPAVPHARYYGGAGVDYVNVLVFEEVANARYRVEVVWGNPIAFGDRYDTACGPFEFRMTIETTSLDDPDSAPNEAGGIVLVTPGAGTKLFRLETVDNPDGDGDSVPNNIDNCPQVFNLDQADTDADEIGNSCEPTSGPCFAVSTADCDGDSHSNWVDNCPVESNAAQWEAEARESLPFGWGYPHDGIGDACDRNPLSFDLGNVLRINRYSDPICVGTDADSDGWCAADDEASDNNGADTPEGTGAGGDDGSCANNVDDDLDGLTDFADSGCPDTDGDRIIDSVDVCPQAADPLQLDTDSTTTGGDACQVLANGERPYVAGMEAYPSRAGAHANIQGRIVEPAPRKLHETRGGYVEITDAGWTVTPGASIPDGAIREAVSTVIGTTLAPSHTCNYALPVTFTLIDASLNYSDLISTGNGYAPLVADVSPANGLSDGAEKMPAFLTTAKVLDDDGDGRIDEDDADAFDEDGDGRFSEDRPAIVRLFGQTYAPHAAHVLNVMIYSPVINNNDGDGATDEDPVDGIDNDFPTDGRIDEDPVEGFEAVFILGDPSTSPLVGSVSAFCTPFEARRTRLALTLDNPLTAAGGEAGLVSLRNSTVAGQKAFSSVFTEQPDADGDLIENGLDTCPLLADNDLEGGPDNTDATPWNPRLVSPPGDSDGNGVPQACEPVTPPGGGGGGMRFAPAPRLSMTTICNPANDCDGDGRDNTADNCVGTANASQADSDGDGIGDTCDPNTMFPDGASQTYTGGQPVCNESALVLDLDRDNFCAAIDPDDGNDSSAGGIPEISGLIPLLCSDDIDNDGDMAPPSNPGDGIDVDGYLSAPRDSGCADGDNDNIMDHLDNCPNTANTNQLDTDGDTAALQRVGQQPFMRTTAGGPIDGDGTPSQVLGQPFMRTDKWGGDACDPDRDGDLLPNLTELTGVCTGTVTDPKLNADCDNDRIGDLTDYIFSAGCVTSGAFTCPGAGSTCLGMFNPVPSWSGSEPDPVPGPPVPNDFLFHYGEAQLHKAAFAGIESAVPVVPNPCVEDADIMNNDDNDPCGTQQSCRNGIERFIGTNPSAKCADNTTPLNEPTGLFTTNAEVTDFNDDRRTNLSDVIKFGPFFNIPGPTHANYEGLVDVNPLPPTTNNDNVRWERGKRYDINASGSVNLSDVIAMGSKMNLLCSP